MIIKQYGRNTGKSKNFLELVEDNVYNFRTKYKNGFTNDEINQIKSQYIGLNQDKFNNAMIGNICMLIDDEVISYHYDVYNALKCGIENRNLTATEWD